ncbi:MAG: type II toxin-antitoxin system PemK/MazF family toxin [Bacteroidia bacterium]
MKTGDIILVPFPFAEMTNRKVRPAVIIGFTKDKHKDVIVSAISSVLPEKKTENEIFLEPTAANKLRSRSVLKVDRIVTLKKEDIIVRLGKLTESELATFKRKFKNLIDV